MNRYQYLPHTVPVETNLLTPAHGDGLDPARSPRLNHLLLVLNMIGKNVIRISHDTAAAAVVSTINYFENWIIKVSKGPYNLQVKIMFATQSNDLVSDNIKIRGFIA